MVQAQYLMGNTLTEGVTGLHQPRDHDQNPQSVKIIATRSHILNQMFLKHYEHDETSLISNYTSIIV
jgi:hypothetical protein